MQAHAIPGPWAAGERILVCVSEDPRAAGLVRYAKRLADRLHAPFTALYVETRRSLQWTEEERDRVADTLRLAEALGGEAITIPGGGRSIADDVIGFAQANNVTQIIIGKSTRSRWFEILHGSVVHDLVRRPATSASTSSPAMSLRAIRSPRRRCARRKTRRLSIRGPMRSRCSRLPPPLGVGELDSAVARDRECRSRVSDRGGRRRRALWALAVAARHRRLVALLQFLLSSADLYLHDHRSDQPRRFRVLHHRGGRGLALCGARTNPDRGRA